MIANKSFLGAEFLTWLWFNAELNAAVRLASGESVAVEIVKGIALEAQFGDARGAALSGESPATAPEAATALLQGKKLKRATFKLAHGDHEWIVTLEAATLSIAGLALPKTGKLPFEENLGLRLAALEQLELTIGLLYETFMALRLDEGLWKPELRGIQHWVEGK